MTSKPTAHRRLRTLIPLFCGTLCLASLGIAASRHAPPPSASRAGMVPAEPPLAAGAPRGAASAEPGLAQRAELALGYDATRDPGDRQIDRAQRAVRRAPGSAPAYLALATAFHKKQRQSSDASLSLLARDAIAAARALNPEDPKLLTFSALLASEQHRFRDARDLARRALERAPDDSTAHLVLGDAELELGQTEAAVASYQRAMDLRPDLRSYNRGAYARWLHGDIDGALELYELAFDAGSARDPESLAWCWVDLGQLELRRGNARRAKAAAARALALVSEYAPALALAARADSDLGDLRSALDQLERAVARAPNAEELVLLAELADRAGDRARAARRMAQAEALAEKEPRILAEHWARRGQRSADALRLAEKELRDRPNVHSHATHALALLRAGRIPEARAAIDRALALGTPQAEFELYRGLIQLAERDRDAAEKSLERALALNPNADRRLATELRRGIRDSR